jgi:hypothetical protein
MGRDLCQQRHQFGAVKLPLKRRWALVGQVFIPGQPEPDGFQVGKVIGREHLPLDDRDVAFHLVQPTGVDRGLDHLDAGVDLMPPVLRRVTARRRAVVHDPEQAFGRMIRCLRQHLVHQAAKRLDAGRRFTPAHHVSPADLPGRELWPGATAFVLVFEAHRSARGGRQGRVTADAGLDARLLVGTEKVVLGAKGRALPGARLHVQNRSGLLGDVRIPGQDPVLVPPGLDGIGRQHPPHRAPTDRSTQRWLGACRHVGQRLPTQRWLGFRHQFAGHSLDQRLVQRGKNGGGAPVSAHRAGRSPLWPIAVASGGPNRGANPLVWPPPHATGGAARATGAPSWRVGAAGT